MIDLPTCPLWLSEADIRPSVGNVRSAPKSGRYDAQRANQNFSELNLCRVELVLKFGWF